MALITQPRKDAEIPDGASHWVYAMVYPFFKYENGVLQQFVEKEWLPITDRKSVITFEKQLKALVEIVPVQPVKRVQTIYGQGTLIDSDRYRGRVMIDLDDNPFGYRPAAFYGSEIISYL